MRHAESVMPESTYKVIELIGTSTDSSEKAAAAAIERASQNLRDLRVAEVKELDSSWRPSMAITLRSPRASHTTANSNFGMRWTAGTAAMTLALILSGNTASATPLFATQTHERCTVCHRHPPANTRAGEDLNITGQRFKASGYVWPIQPICTTQQMQLFDKKGVSRGEFPVQVCN